MKKKSAWNTQALLLFIMFNAAWELLVQAHFIPEFLFPAPSQVLQTLFSERADFLLGFKETLTGTFIGFILSVLIGTLVSIIFSLSKFLKKSVLPFAVFFQTMPIIAVAPLLVIYFGFGMPTVIAASFIVSVFPIIANTLLGLDNVPVSALELFKVYSATPWQTMIKLRLPAAYPMIYAGWKVSIGLAIIGAIAGEFVAGGGLGAMIDAARTQQRIDIVFACLLLLSLMGIALMTALRVGHNLLQRYRPFGQNIQEN